MLRRKMLTDFPFLLSDRHLVKLRIQEKTNYRDQITNYLIKFA